MILPIPNFTLGGINQMAAVVLASLLNTLWYAAGVVGLTWALLRFLPRVNAATRYWIWTAVLSFLFVLPFLPMAMSQTRLVLEGRTQKASSAEKGVSVPLAQPPGLSQESRRLAPIMLTFDSPGSTPWPLWLLAIWILAAGWQLARLAAGVVSVRRLKDRSAECTSFETWGLPADFAQEAADCNKGGLLNPLRRKARVLTSEKLVSPVAVGYMHPAVMVPPGLLASLDKGERLSVLLHELAHLARYDDWFKLAASAVGALLALHPLVPFVLRRIEREREMACDDSVVEQTGLAYGYAQSLARLHDLCSKTGTKLLAPALLGRKVSLIDRIESLLRRDHGFSARPSLANLGVSAFLLAVLLGAGGLIPRWLAVAQTSLSLSTSLCADLPKSFCANLPSKFEVASIRPARPGGGQSNFLATPNGRYRGTNLSARDLIAFAYGIGSHHLEGLPSWAKSRRYTIVAEAPPGLASDFQMIGTFPANQRHQALVNCQHSWSAMMQALLADRFQLKVHHTTKQLPVYELVLAKRGPKLDPPNASDFPGVLHRYSLGSQWFTDDASKGTRQLNGFGIHVSDLVGFLSGETAKTVIDRTGLTGRYDIKLTWTPSPGASTETDFGENSGDNRLGRMPADVHFSGHPVPIVTAIQQQLGLKLKSAKGPVQVVVVDRIEPPTPN